MSFLTILALAFGMSMDAFAAAIAQGAAIGTPTRRGTLRTAAVFGSVETLTPLIGWAIGSVAQRYIGLATTIMAALGLRLGSLLGNAIGKRAEILGGLVLIGIGTLILAEHLHFL